MDTVRYQGRPGGFAEVSGKDVESSSELAPRAQGLRAALVRVQVEVPLLQTRQATGYAEYRKPVSPQIRMPKTPPQEMVFGVAAYGRS